MSALAILQQQAQRPGPPPPSSSLLLGAYAHHSVQSPHRTLEALVGHLLSVGVAELRPKTHQWLTWSGRWESSGAWDLENIGAYQALAARARELGLRIYPWCVPMGLDVEAEAQLAAQVARVASRIDFDLEPYVDFWPGLAVGDYSAVKPFFRRVRELVGSSVEITLDFPARDSAHEWGRIRPAVELAAPFVDRLALQSYFGVAQAADAERRVRALGTGHPVDHISDVPHLAGMLAYAGQSEAERLLIWREADLDAAADVILLEHASGGEPEPQDVGSRVVEQNQFVCSNYDSQGECAKLRAYACAPATLAGILTAYRRPSNISDALRLIRATGDDVLTDAEAAAVGSNGGGLQNRNGQAQAVADVLSAVGLAARTHAVPRERQAELEAVLRSGRPIAVQLNDYHDTGHYAALKALTPDGLVEVADSNTGQFQWPPAIAWGTYWAARGAGRQVWVD